MDPKAESVDREEDARDTVAAAREAAAAGPLAQRVSELETVLAVERAESARRLKEMDALMRQTRSALHALQGDYRRTVSERDELRETIGVREAEVRELEQRVRQLRESAERATTEREGSTAEVVAAAIARAQRSEAELARARQTIVKLHENVRAVEDGGADERIATLERQIALREQELIRAAEKLGEFEECIDDHEAAAAVRENELDVACGPDTIEDPVAAGPIGGSSTYIPVDADITRTSTHKPLDGSSTYLPVVADAVSETEDSPAPSVAEAAADAADVGRKRRTPPAGSVQRRDRQVVVSKTRSPRKRPPAELPVLEGLAVEREVARDADGVLLHARDTATDRSVVVRVFARGTVRPSQSSVERILAVRHHNVAAILRCVLGPDGPHVVCERPAGERVDAWVRRVGRVPESIALAVVLQVARGLREGAVHGVHHGDLSPWCLWTDAAGVVRVSGLGFRELMPHREIRAPQPFVAPERHRGEAPDARSDMFAVGVCLRSLVAGPVDDAASVDLDKLRPRVSSEVRELVASLAAEDREQRPEDWDDAVARIDAVLRERAKHAADADGVADGLIGMLAHRPHVLAGILALLVMIVAGWIHLMPGDENTLHEDFNAAIVRAEQLEAQGNVEGARRIYSEFLEDTGDADIELDAARRLDALRE